MMAFMLGVIRIVVTILLLPLAAVTITVASLFTNPKAHLPVALRVTQWWVKVVLLLYNIKVVTTNEHRLLNHQGFVFPNHSSFLDPLLLLSVRPVRFLGMAAVGRWFLIGTIARAIGTVFVERETKQSRYAARQALENLVKVPPIALFPEGKITPPFDVAPFRYGAFELAIASNSHILPLSIAYFSPTLIDWGPNPTWRQFWRFAARAESLDAQLDFMPVVDPVSASDVSALAADMRAAVEMAVTVHNGAETVQDAFSGRSLTGRLLNQ